MARLPLSIIIRLCVALTLTACSAQKGSEAGGGDDSPLDGGGGGGSFGDGGGGDGDGPDGPDPDGGMPADGAVGDGSTSCKTACAPDDCGELVSDGCGGHLTCPVQCPEGQACGVQRPDKCDYPEAVSCTPKTAAEVCPGKCGAVENGCSGVIDCTSANGGVSCGANQYCQASACVDTVTACTPIAASVACEDKCGVVSDGCDDVYVCSAANGGVSCDVNQRCDEQPASDTRYTCVALPPPSCTPELPANACDGTCGIVDDGCGEQIDCEMTGFGCQGDQTCGGGGQPGECGSGSACMPTPASEVCAGKCGFMPDGCGSGYNCDGTNGGVICDGGAGESCGGGGVRNECGKPPCTPIMPGQACPGSGAFKSCGKVSDGCGNLVDCGGCPTDQSCGLQTANLCGAVPVCQPTPIAAACASKCGDVPDGCGGKYTCNGSNGGVTCSGNEYCGATQPNACGAPPVTCTPKTCAQLGHSCGLASNGCGQVINCWPGCSPSNLGCGGSCDGSSSCLSNATTGAQSCVAGTPTCSGALCGSVPTSCAANSPTRLTGTVRTPGRLNNGNYINQLPVPNALIYIPADPNVALPGVFEGVNANDPLSCGRCADEKLVADGQSVLAAAVTDYRGQFTLEGRIPVGAAFKLVIKVGKWRRVVQVPAGVAVACSSAALTHDQTRLPAHKTDGLGGTHLPKVAISTGDVDEMECVFRNMGIAESEFTVPTGTGRVHLYRANGAMPNGVVCSGTYRDGRRTRDCSRNDNVGCRDKLTGCSWEIDDTNLFGTQARLNGYDLVVFDCEASEQRHAAADETRIENYVNAGGRMFASHFSYVWIENRTELARSATWGTTGSADSATGFISMPSGPTARTGANGVKAPLFRDWLDFQGALAGTTAGVLNNPTTPQFTISAPRDRAGPNVGAATDEWVYRGTGTSRRVQQLSFNTPYAAAESNICGRVAYSGFHVANASNEISYFPSVCSNGELSAQEKILAFMLFDLSTCVSAGDPPQPPACVPKTTAEVCPGANDACGYVSDGCGGVVDCAGCASGFYCDGNTCRPQECTPQTCASLGFNCGNHADGCGGIARNAEGIEGCGTCTSGQACGLGGAGLCGASSCVPKPFATACPAGSCGLVSDGCGGTYQCGTCPDGVCGGGGPNQCGAGSCVALSEDVACANKNCGLVGDGCGGSYECGTCLPPLSCGGGGQANVCGKPVCAALSKEEACAGLDCGWVSDGCGGAIQCGTCPNGGVCGGAGPNRCGSSCTPTTCSAQGAKCGAISDGCGGVLSCGNCPSGQTCGAAAANQCGSGPSCTARTCEQAGAECGLVGDGCGGVLDCGVCTAPGQSCGGAGQANQCGSGSGGCNKQTCDGQGIQCGAASDGCGGLLDCGGCGPGYQCERGACTVLPPVVL